MSQIELVVDLDPTSRGENYWFKSPESLQIIIHIFELKDT